MSVAMSMLASEQHCGDCLTYSTAAAVPGPAARAVHWHAAVAAALQRARRARAACRPRAVRRRRLFRQCKPRTPRPRRAGRCSAGGSPWKQRLLIPEQTLLRVCRAVLGAGARGRAAQQAPPGAPGVEPHAGIAAGAHVRGRIAARGGRGCSGGATHTLRVPGDPVPGRAASGARWRAGGGGGRRGNCARARGVRVGAPPARAAGHAR